MRAKLAGGGRVEEATADVGCYLANDARSGPHTCASSRPVRGARVQEAVKGATSCCPTTSVGDRKDDDFEVKSREEGLPTDAVRPTRGAA